MSFEILENTKFECEINTKLQEAEEEAKNTDIRYSSKEVFDNLKKTIENNILE